MQKGFIFDLNKCTGCNACQIACSIENDVALPYNWRQVITYNQVRHPDLPCYHLSMACHHCLDPPCQTYCPALAYSKDPTTGSLTIDSTKCIGCQYCNWCCPYDAPVFIPAKGIMEKCTFCQHRLDENLLPACVAICPTDALQFGDFENSGSTIAVAGFSTTRIKPAVTFIPFRQGKRLPEMPEHPYDQRLTEKYREVLDRRLLKKKIRCLSEWPLVIFTVISALLTGVLSGILMGTTHLNPFIALGTGLFGMAISTLHLGKKFRAARAVLNWRSSWLSREIIYYTLLILFLALYSTLFPDAAFLGWTALIFGFMTLYAMDRVYSILPLEEHSVYHRTQALLTGCFFVSIFSGFTFGIILFGLIKLMLYTNIAFRQIKTLSIDALLIRSARILAGFFLPLLILLSNPDYVQQAVLFLILPCELIDRCVFYDTIKILTPYRQMSIDLHRDLNKTDTERDKWQTAAGQI
jgi:Fe-S-cluster-containing dehydrogenase component/DMSO reductase anchor subunit